MGIGTSIFLLAVGAILAFAVHLTTNPSGIDVQTVGWILMIVGGLGMLLSLAFWSSWGGFGGYRRHTVVEDRGTTYVDRRDRI